MTSDHYHFSTLKRDARLQAQAEHEFSLKLAVLCSLLLHGLLLIAVPALQHKPLQKPVRFEVQMNKLVTVQATSKSQHSEQAAVTQSPVKEQSESVTPQVLQKTDKRVLPSKTALEPSIVHEVNEPVLKQTQESQAVKNVEQSYSSEASNISSISTASPAKGTEDSKETASPGQSVSVNQAEGPSSNESASTEEAWNGYGQQLYEMVGRHKTYPAIAVRKHWEGAVKIQAKFLAGKLIEVSIHDSSGRRILDDEALNMVKKAISQLPVNGSLSNKSFTVVIPVDFSLTS